MLHLSSRILILFPQKWTKAQEVWGVRRLQRFCWVRETLSVAGLGRMVQVFQAAHLHEVSLWNWRAQQNTHWPPVCSLLCPLIFNKSAAKPTVFKTFNKGISQTGSQPCKPACSQWAWRVVNRQKTQSVIILAASQQPKVSQPTSRKEPPRPNLIIPLALFTDHSKLSEE